VLTNAILTEARFDRTRLSGANLSGANLSGANLSATIGLSQRQLARACGDQATILPPDLYIAQCARREAPQP
jgi:uncharacterized protein YjbI with pentapeptide repeats